MKVLILSVADRRHMPMVSVYEKYLQKKGVQYDIIRISRYEKANDSCSFIYEFEWIKSVNISKLKKIIPFLRFKSYATKIIRKEKYNFIIVWNENTAILFGDVLSKRYKGRYCVNVRDISSRKIYQMCIDKVVSDSCFSTLPSPAGVPNNRKYRVLYNRDDNLLDLISPKNSMCKNGKIKITFLGFYSRVSEASLRLCECLGNDDRFELVFAGRGFDTNMKEIIGDKYSNVTLEGPFKYEDTAKYLADTDIVNSYYACAGTDNINCMNAVGIKESYIPMLYIPGLIDSGTYFDKLNEDYKFCFAIDDNNLEKLGDSLYEWYMNLDFDVFKANCDRFNMIIDKSRKELFELCDHFILKENN